MADPAWGHVHNLTLDGSRLLLGTHDGLWQQDSNQPATLVSEPPFDVMALAVGPDRLLASGHPAPGQNLPADLGLRESTDGGLSWQTLSLEGEVDFHRLTTAENAVLGLSAHDGRLLRSMDGGQTWLDLGLPAIYDLAIDPKDPERVLATTERGPVQSDDGGHTFSPTAGAPLLALLAWSGSVVYGVAPNGDVYISDDATIWTRTGSVGGPPEAIAADGERLVVLTDGTIVESTDAGATFTDRITGLDGH